MEHKKKIVEKTEKKLSDEISKLENIEVNQITKSELQEISSGGKKSEVEIQKLLKNFEADLRKGLEKYVKLQKTYFESVLRGEIPVFSTNKNKKISFVIISDARPEPIFVFDWEAAPDFNEADLAKSMYEFVDRYIKSKEYLEIQKKNYYRLKSEGYKPAEILPLIELYWDNMDSITKKNLKTLLRNDYVRKTEKKKDTK